VAKFQYFRTTATNIDILTKKLSASWFQEKFRIILDILFYSLLSEGMCITVVSRPAVQVSDSVCRRNRTQVGSVYNQRCGGEHLDIWTEMA
jgi:hypothetical protein